MFCSSCGASLSTSLTYCNRCGARTTLSTNPLELTKPHEDKLVEVVHMTGIVSGAVTIAGFIFVFVIILKLLEHAIKPSAIAVFMIFSLAAVFGVSSLLIRQFSRALSAYLREGENEGKRELKKVTTPQLEAHREPAPSVTEHTTRAFEPVLKERGN